MNKKLILYSQETYYYLKEEYENKGFHLDSFATLLYFNNNFLGFDKLYNYNKIILDISSLIALIENNESNIFILEQFFYFLNDKLKKENFDMEFESDNNLKIIFICDKKYNSIDYKTKYCFDEIIEYKCDKIIKNKNIQNTINTKIKKVIDIDENYLDTFFEEFEKSIYGHTYFKKKFRDNINIFKLFNKLGEHHILSFFLMGPSGIGKTEVAKSIHKSLGCNGDFIKINFGNYSSKDSLNSLIGSPRGYLGSESGELFNKLLNSDSGVILIDEFEKANNKVFNYFLEMLETGKATNSQGEEFNLNGYIIIFTSNVKKSEFQNVFSPELISRFNCICYFEYLTLEEKSMYIENRVNDIISKYTEINPDIKINAQEIISNINKNFNNIRDINLNIRSQFFKYINQK